MTDDEIIHAAFPVSYTQPGERIMTITDDEIIKLAREAGFEILGDEIGINDRWHIQTELIKRLIYVVAAAEREACAIRAGIALLGADRGLANRVDQSIRARGEK